MRILSLNGGGSRGYVTARLLQKMEEFHGKKCHEMFDMITGVSTGSIVAGMLGLGYSAKEIADFYRAESPKIFSNKRCFFMNLFKPKYNKNNLAASLNKFFNVPFSDMKVKVMAYAIRLDKPDADVKFWKSWRSESANVKAADVIQASCSAPTYFAPHTFGEKTYVDGGPFCNNPSMCAIAESIRLGEDIKNTTCFNIELDKWDGFDKPQKIDSLIEWLLKIAPLCLGSVQNAISYQARQVISDNLTVVQAHRWTEMDSQDFDEMDKIIDEMWERNKDKFTKI